jgi:hypothetical protein
MTHDLALRSPPPDISPSRALTCHVEDEDVGRKFEVFTNHRIFKMQSRLLATMENAPEILIFFLYRISTRALSSRVERDKDGRSTAEQLKRDSTLTRKVLLTLQACQEYWKAVHSHGAVCLDDRITSTTGWTAHGTKGPLYRSETCQRKEDEQERCLWREATPSCYSPMLHYYKEISA